MDALRNFLENRQIEDKNDPQRDTREEILNRLKSHGLHKPRYDKLSNTELRNLATNIAAVNQIDPSDLVPNDINTQSSNVHHANNMVNQPNTAQPQPLQPQAQVREGQLVREGTRGDLGTSTALFSQIPGSNVRQFRSRSVDDIETGTPEESSAAAGAAAGASTFEGGSGAVGDEKPETGETPITTLAQVADGSQNSKKMTQEEAQKAFDERLATFVKKFQYDPRITKENIWAKFTDEEKKEFKSKGNSFQKATEKDLQHWIVNHRGLEGEDLSKFRKSARSRTMGNASIASKIERTNKKKAAEEVSGVKKGSPTPGKAKPTVRVKKSKK
jgi:hypothetical protein